KSYRSRRNLLSLPTRRSSDLAPRVHAQGLGAVPDERPDVARLHAVRGDRPEDRLVDLLDGPLGAHADDPRRVEQALRVLAQAEEDRKSTRLNSSHVKISYAVS